MSVRTFLTDRGDDRRRLDLVVMRHLADVPGLSRTRVQAWVEAGRVRLDDRTAPRAALRVLAGQRVVVTLEVKAPRDAGPQAQDLPLSILFEDAHLLAVDKPAGLIVHPSYGHRDGTLVNALVHYAARWPAGRPSLVHRLDKDTSGVIVVAKSREAHAALVRALARDDAAKEYLALCYGRMRAGRRRLRLSLGRDPGDRRRVIVRDDGREAVTEVTRIASSCDAARGLTLVRCRLITGRMHQIRVHLLASGLPIVGDPMYGAPGWRRVRDAALAEQLRGFPRQALHAWRLTLRHPFTGTLLTLEAPLPADLAALLAEAGLVTGP